MGIFYVCNAVADLQRIAGLASSLKRLRISLPLQLEEAEKSVWSCQEQRGTARAWQMLRNFNDNLLIIIEFCPRIGFVPSFKGPASPEKGARGLGSLWQI